jgi:hypothetical protein
VRREHRAQRDAEPTEVALLAGPQARGDAHVLDFVYQRHKIRLCTRPTAVPLGQLLFRQR